MTRGKPFAKGNSANPGGRPKIDPKIQEAKKTTYAEFVDGVTKYGRMEKDELKKEVKRGDIRCFDLIFARVVEQSTDGDRYARDVLMDRLWGKPKETELTLPHQELLSRIPLADLIELARKAKGEINGSCEQENTP